MERDTGVLVVKVEIEAMTEVSDVIVAVEMPLVEEETTAVEELSDAEADVGRIAVELWTMTMLEASDIEADVEISDVRDCVDVSELTDVDEATLVLVELSAVLSDVGAVLDVVGVEELAGAGISVLAEPSVLDTNSVLRVTTVSDVLVDKLIEVDSLADVIRVLVAVEGCDEATDVVNSVARVLVGCDTSLVDTTALVDDSDTDCVVEDCDACSVVEGIGVGLELTTTKLEDAALEVLLDTEEELSSAAEVSELLIMVFSVVVVPATVDEVESDGLVIMLDIRLENRDSRDDESRVVNVVCCSDVLCCVVGAILRVETSCDVDESPILEDTDCEVDCEVVETSGVVEGAACVEGEEAGEAPVESI